ncbi:MAG: hypothetical protein ACTHN5_10720 [Phycisphaerae bacterium]
MIHTCRKLQQLILTTCLLAAGCQASSPRHAESTAPVAPAAPAPGRVDLHTDPATLSDPCSDNLQNLCEAILLYFTANKHLPPTLQDLQPYAEKGAPLQFKCPTSGDAYAYEPQGLSAAGVHDRLLVYDTRPVHEGHRWGIVIAPPRPAQPITVFVIPLQQSLLNAYLHK